MRRQLGLVLFALALWPIGARAQYCPCYSSISASNPNKCGVADVQGSNPSVAEWRAIIESACEGPSGAGWGDGPTIAPIGLGCDGSGAKVAAHYPCELIEALAMQESRWVQFCSPTEPTDRKGGADTTIVAKDCGYGVAQVTTGMHQGETASWDRDRVAADARYALQVGLQILADKWRVTACVGSNDPDLVESWYLAAWAYNGYSFSNNPNNPNFDAVRPVCDPNGTCPGRPYQEKLWAWMEYPPPDGRWKPLQPAYPDLTEIPSTSGPKPMNLSPPHCAAPTHCTESREVHVSRCVGGFPPEDLGTVDGDTPPGDGGTSRPDGGCACTVGRTAHVPWPLLALVGLALLSLRAIRLRGR